MKKKVVWIVLLGVIILGAGGYAFYNYRLSTVQAQATETPLQTAQARRGELVISASGIGTVIAAAEMSVGFASSGLIEAIYVTVGEQVKAGDVLAQQGDLVQLELAVRSDEMTLANAQTALQELYDGWEMQRATAELAVYEAQEALDEAIKTRQAMDYPRCSQSTIDDYYYTYLDAVQMVNDLVSRNATSDRISNAESVRDTAYVNYSYCVSERTAVEIGKADTTVALMQAELNQAKMTLGKIQDGPDPDEILKAEAAVEIAEVELAVSKENLEKATLVSPMNGTVMQITAQAGETTGQSFITIADLQIPMLEIFLDETDLSMAGVGYEVEVTFDALADQTFIGHIISVDPSLTQSGMTAVVRAVVQLDPASFNKPQTLPVGLSASVEVIGSRAVNAVLVPVEALRDLGEGQYAVFVMENGKPKLRLVEVGIMDYTYAEILSGLDAGETVTTGIVETE